MKRPCTMLKQAVLPLGLSTDSKFRYLAVYARLLEEEDLERVIRKLVKEGVSEKHARDLRVEFLRFVSLKFVTRQSISPSVEVDRFWHAFILDTRLYETFCQRHLDSFLHHDQEDQISVRLVGEDMPGTRTRKLLEQIYPDHDRGIWATMAICQDDEGDTYDDD